MNNAFPNESTYLMIKIDNTGEVYTEVSNYPTTSEARRSLFKWLANSTEGTEIQLYKFSGASFHFIGSQKLD